MHPEQAEVDSAGALALERGISDMLAPDRQALTVTFFHITGTHYRPAYVALENSAARLDLIIDVHEAQTPGDPAADFQQQEKCRRVLIASIPGDMPAAGKHEAGILLRMVKDSLGRCRRVSLHAPGPAPQDRRPGGMDHGI
jgi:hypothetical protein